MKIIKRFWNWVRFGKVRSKVVSVDGGVVSEVAYYDRNGLVCGWWAYGSFDPAMPYRGE